MKYERGAFAMNVTGGFYFSAVLEFLISKFQILQFPIFRLVLFFILVILIFYLLDHYVIEQRRYRVAIDRFIKTPKFLKVIYGVFDLILMLGNFFVIFFAIALSVKY